MKRNKLFYVILFLLVSISFSGCESLEEAKPPVSKEKLEISDNNLTIKEEVVQTNEIPTDIPVEETEVVYSNLLEVYDGYFKIGLAMSGGLELKNWERDKDTIIKNFNSITCTNEMKPSYLLSQVASQAGLEDGSTYTSPAVSFDSFMQTVNIAEEHGIQMRLHTLVWHAQTPRWFFTEDYSNDGVFVSRDVMLMRMESFIKQVLEYFKTEHPGLIYAVDVVNEAFNGKITTDNPYGIKLSTDSSPNYWYEIIGDDYIYYAFLYSKKYASEDMKLFYNDFNTYNKINQIINGLQKIQDENLIDGIGMQCHINTKTNLKGTILKGLSEFSKAGYEVHITELDMGMDKGTESSLLRQGMKFKYLMTELQKMVDNGVNLTSVSVWGLTDRVVDGHWRAGEHALLFDENGKEKPAYRGMLQDPEIIAMDY